MEGSLLLGWERRGDRAERGQEQTNQETNEMCHNGGSHSCLDTKIDSLSVGLANSPPPMSLVHLHGDVQQHRAAMERLGRSQLGREERQRGGARAGRAPLLRHVVLAAHPGHRVRERAGVPGRAEGALPADHHQLPGGQPGGGRPAGGLSGHAVGRVPGGEDPRGAFPVAGVTFKDHLKADY